MFDETEATRREMVVTINANAGPRAELEATYGQVWDTSQLQDAFQVIGFAAPFVIVRRRSDGVKGSLLFQNDPRFYYGFEPA